MTWLHLIPAPGINVMHHCVACRTSRALVGPFGGQLSYRCGRCWRLVTTPGTRAAFWAQYGEMFRMLRDLDEVERQMNNE